MAERIAHYEGSGLEAPTDVVRTEIDEDTSEYHLLSGTPFWRPNGVEKDAPTFVVSRPTQEIGKLVEGMRQEYPESPWVEARQPRFTFEVRWPHKSSRELQVALLTHAVLMDVLFEVGTTDKNWGRGQVSENVGIIDTNEGVSGFYRDQLHMHSGMIPRLGERGITLALGYETDQWELLSHAGNVVGDRDIHISHDLPGDPEVVSAINAQPFWTRRAERFRQLGETDELKEA